MKIILLLMCLLGSGVASAQMVYVCDSITGECRMIYIEDFGG